MNSEPLSEVLQRARQNYGDGMVHLLVSWLKCARILLLDSARISKEVIVQLQTRAFLKIDAHNSDDLALHLGKDDLFIVSSGQKVASNVTSKVVGFGAVSTGWDAGFICDLDSSATIYFDQALAAFTGSLNDSLDATKYLFLDRDGVIIDYVSYPDHPSQVSLRDGIVEVIAEYRRQNYRIVMVTNQSGIARGYSSQEDFRQVQSRTLELLAQKGQWIDACYFATYIANSNIAQTLQYPSLRKPRIGMLAEEAQFWNIDLENSVMIGDNVSDVEWAQNAGLGKIFWLDNPELKEKSPNRMTNVVEIQNLIQSLSKV